MKKIFCVFLCFALLIPFLLVPVSAADDSLSGGAAGIVGSISSSVSGSVKFALYEDKFIYGGVEYPLTEHSTDGPVTPYFIIAGSDFFYVVMTVRNIEHSLDMFPTLKEQYGYDYSAWFTSEDGVLFEYKYDLTLITYYQYSYDIDNSLTFVGYGESSSEDTFSFPGTSFSQLKQMILCNRFPVFYRQPGFDPILLCDISSVKYQPADPLASDGFFYLNDGSWSDPNFHGRRDVYYSNLSGNWDWDHGFTYDEDASAVMMQVSSDLVDVLWFQSKDGKGNPVTPLISVSSRFHSLSGVDRYYYGLNIVFSTSINPNASLAYMIQRLRISYADDGSVSGLTKVQESSGRGSLSMYPIEYCYDLDQFLGNVVLCTRFPIYLFDSPTVGFWENPRGHNCDPSYKPVPPLDMLLPGLPGTLGTTPDDMNSVLVAYASGILFLTAVFECFLDVPPIQSVLTVSFGLGFLLFVLNIVPVVVSGVRSSVSRRRSSSKKSSNNKE